MKASLFFLSYFLAAAFLAAFIAFPLFQLAQSDAYQFERWVTRSALLLLVIGIFPTLIAFKLSFNAIGHNTTIKDFLSKFLFSFVTGLCILVVVVLSILLLDIRIIDMSKSLTTKLILSSIFAGLLVAFIEETLFRGLFFTLSKRWHTTITAIIVSSFFYALLHFINPIEHIDSLSLNWLSGTDVILNAFNAVLLLNITDFLALFSVGVLLAMVRHRTNSLVYCIGLHASWVFLIKISKELSTANSSSEWSFLVGQYDGIIGLLCFTWLVIVISTYWFYIVKVSKSNLTKNPIS